MGNICSSERSVQYDPETTKAPQQSKPTKSHKLSDVPEAFEYVIMADFDPQQKGDLKVRKGEFAHRIKINDDKSWANVKLQDTGLKGWIPNEIVARENSIETMGKALPCIYH